MICVTGNTLEGVGMSTDGPVFLGDDEPPTFVILGAPRDNGQGGAALSLGRRLYHQISGEGNAWREAGTYTEDDGSTAFKAAGLMADGTLVGHVESLGRTRCTADVRIAPDGKWSSVVQSGDERTESVGQLRASAEQIKSRRTKSHGDAILWTADATTEFDVTGDDGSHIARRTKGTVSYALGGTGSFSTDYFSIDPKRSQSDAGWSVVTGLGPTASGTEKFTVLPGGPGNWRWDRQIVDHKTGDRQIDAETHEEKLIDGRTENTTSEKHTVIPASGPSSSTSTTEKVTWDDRGAHWTRTTTSVDGKQTVERGEYSSGGGTASVSTSTVHPDQSVTVTTTTWDLNTGRGQQHSVTTSSSGEILTDTTTQGTGDITNTDKRPGDLGPIFTPDPANGTDSGSSGGSSNSGSSSGGEGTGDDGSEQGSGGDEGEHGGEEESVASDDGSGDDDTGGYPGLGWDGGNGGPFALLPDAAAAALGRFNDPNHPIDDLGNDSSLTGLMAEALSHAVSHGDRSDGQGADTGDPLHGVSEDTLVAAARAARPVDPEWGDWSNPKAHALFVKALTADVRETVHDAAAFEVASAINKFL